MRRVELPPPGAWIGLVRRALDEDLGSGDATTALVVPPDQTCEAVIEAREPLLVCGMAVCEAAFSEVDRGVDYTACCPDGSKAQAGTVLAEVRGRVHSVLAAERVALNLLARMCGVATLTRRFVEEIEGTRAQIVDTRKTLPGWRVLDKYAVATAGALNHRVGLFDGILLKDNHVAAAGGVALAVKSALAAAPHHLRVQIEVESEADALAALEAGADFLLLDNWPLERLRASAPDLAQRCVVEVSGGVRFETVRAIAETGVQRISIGALTHSALSVDLSLELRQAPGAGRTTTPGGVRA